MIEVAVLLMVVQFCPLLIENSQRVTFPTLPLSTTVTLLPEQTATVLRPFTVADPPTEAGLTVTLTDLVIEQLPFEIKTLYVPVLAVVAAFITGFCAVEV